VLVRFVSEHGSAPIKITISPCAIQVVLPHANFEAAIHDPSATRDRSLAARGARARVHTPTQTPTHSSNVSVGDGDDDGSR